ncbi:MAG: 3-phosphoglycerate dehydrogenase, partial [Enterobacterales bacterium]|nr:3-phosphoglycerate dehydrogenase [Enterobacterales bacterium]
MFYIKTYNKISPRGLAEFPADFYQVSDSETQPHGLLLRSQKLHDEEFPKSLLGIARAGAGTNNIPIERCTDQGIVVFNTPGANANAVKELVLAGLLLGSRGIIQGHDFVNGLTDIQESDAMSKLLEAEKKKYAGSELMGKTLGIVGLGAIGSLVADAALSLGMKVMGYDPALSIDAAWRLSSRVQRMESLEQLLGKVDYVTLHVPAIEATKNLINEENLQLMKANAVILNFARAAIVDSKAIVTALDAHALGQYICDFPEPWLINHDRVTALPHIGASTSEAEENCATMAVSQLREFLEHGNIKNSVNFPATEMARGNTHARITFTNLNQPGVLGDVLSLFAEHNINIVD